MQYTHSGDPVDVTFGVKELKVRSLIHWDNIVLILNCVPHTINLQILNHLVSFVTISIQY